MIGGLGRPLRGLAHELRLHRLPGAGAVVLMYHRFRPDDAPGRVLTRRDFAAQVDLLREHYEVLPLEEALARPRGDRVATITVDDGYRSFAEVAHPVLRERGLAATVFLPVGFIAEGGWMWQDRNIHLMRGATGGTGSFRWRDAEIPLDTTDEPQRLQSMIRIYRACAAEPPEARRSFSEALAEHLQVELPAQPVDEFAPMDWQQVRRLQDEGVMFGSHTVNHQILTLCPEETAEREIADSRGALAELLGRPVAWFAYPNGDFTPRIRDLVAGAGYRGALATTPGFWRSGDDPFAVRRVPAPHGGRRSLLDQLLRYRIRYGRGLVSWPRRRRG